MSPKKEQIIVYADGASSGNPGPGGWGSVVLYAGRVVELGGKESHTTNNRMELTAPAAGLSFILSELDERSRGLPVVMRTDSQYVINGITKWIFTWKKNGWRTALGGEVTNKDLWEILEKASSCLHIEWEYVPGHRGVPGNECADEIATSFSLGKKRKLYSGLYKKYGHDLLDVKPKEIKMIYLSVVEGIIKHHTTWKECEKRVKGVRGAKFKKVPREEVTTTLKAWGL